ncbi:bifunctional demethylmenaquinone methyltransferase/2-methoxy-6-polyprenyl-1,4-benzoquinol methylase UbiE [Roseospirillum parvum]|uniref:Ubiquinone/menaquinone biosynthesis C-methyltransferase UbiE n=1 Tax=Roseospirillum parvum TaxID=83401 RepID=A0A1G7WI85_9PROT|nr:bifunctional demethylmenaquinone methyltransferase/2-methoxy-6-polyprenyl-1,4-benzoquinol methylase UbiE [Roseospirillum parvum]SDG71499.1 demethylmenaquinone methyltransferase / 2-methoxy-6-polyprenyl-1,4-benzoquinol methylase [Roseospirillum parvum]
MSTSQHPPHPAAEAPSADDDLTHFGYRSVPRAEKAGMVRQVFDSVADKYDLMNDLMSGGIHRIWKAALIDWLSPRPGQHLIDVAGGTGDIAFRFLERAAKVGGEGAKSFPARVTVCDINAEMLRVGRRRAADRGHLSGLTWTCGDAQFLPFPDGTFDAYTIAFGLRNVTDPQLALNDAFRALKPGGRYMCLEFSHVVVPVFDRIYDAYSFTVLPGLGQMVAGDRAAYEYLAESIRQFPPQDELAAMMRKAGFENVKYRNLSGGIAAIHSGWKL